MEIWSRLCQKLSELWFLLINWNKIVWNWGILGYYCDNLRHMLLFGEVCGNLRVFETIMWIICIFRTSEVQYWCYILTVYSLWRVRSGMVVILYDWHNLIIWDRIMVVIPVVTLDHILHDYMRLIYPYSCHDVIKYTYILLV